jgi:hypothetical protein
MNPSEIECELMHHSSCQYISGFFPNPECVAHLEGFYSNHPAVSFRLFLIQQFWFSIHPPRAHILIHIFHILITIIYVVSYDSILLSRSTKHLDLNVYWLTLGTHRLPYLDSSFSQSNASRRILY